MSSIMLIIVPLYYLLLLQFCILNIFDIFNIFVVNKTIIKSFLTSN